jgi:AraC-like DNA-binding protein
MTNTQFFFAPHPDLSGIINNIMIGHTVTDDLQASLSFQFPPLPEHSILFYPYDKPSTEDIATKKKRTLYGCTVSGPQTERNILSLGRNHLMIKIGLQPGVLHRLLGEPLQQMLPYRDYDGETVFGTSVRSVIDELANAVSYDSMKNIAENFMFSHLAKIKKAFPIDHVIPQIIRHGGTIKIDNLVQRTCLSNRQFERAFKDRMGVSPKFFSRLVRFGRAWLLKETCPNLTWTQVAYDCNYFDQMHLIRDFKEFADTNPKEISNAFEIQPFILVKGIFQ